MKIVSAMTLVHHPPLDLLPIPPDDDDQSTKNNNVSRTITLSCSDVFQSLHSLQESSRFTDLAFVCADGAAEAHKALVERHSGFLRQVFVRRKACCCNRFDPTLPPCNDLEEAKTTLLLPGTNISSVRHLLQILYTGQSLIASNSEFEGLNKLCVSLAIKIPLRVVKTAAVPKTTTTTATSTLSSGETNKSKIGLSSSNISIPGANSAKIAVSLDNNTTIKKKKTNISSPSPLSPMTISCEKCGQTFATISSYSKHMKIKYCDDPSDPLNKKAVVTCSGKNVAANPAGKIERDPLDVDEEDDDDFVDVDNSEEESEEEEEEEEDSDNDNHIDEEEEEEEKETVNVEVPRNNRVQAKKRMRDDEEAKPKQDARSDSGSSSPDLEENSPKVGKYSADPDWGTENDDDDEQRHSKKKRSRPSALAPSPKKKKKIKTKKEKNPIKKERPSSSDNRPCPDCGRLFVSLGRAREHLASTHLTESLKVYVSEDGKSCTLCGYSGPWKHVARHAGLVHGRVEEVADEGQKEWLDWTREHFAKK